MPQSNTAHNTEVDDLGKEYLPESFNLAVDRSHNAKHRTTDVRKWAKSTNTMDLVGFDTKSEQEKPTRTILRNQGVGYVEQEPDRFLRHDQASYKKLKEVQGKIMDYQSFKSAVQESWSKDTSLKNLVKNMNEGDYKALFDQPEVQKWLNKNAEDLAVSVIMRKYNIEYHRAFDVWNKLPTRKRGALLSRIVQGKKLRVKRMPTPVLTSDRTIRVMRAGKAYQKSKPQKWTEMQTIFINNNREKGGKWLHEYYNRVFPHNRSIASIRNKLYRL